MTKKKIEQRWQGASTLEQLLQDINSLSLDPRNARVHPARNIEAIRGSLERFGQLKPVVVAPGGTVLAGNGLVTVARELGWTHVAVVVYDATPAEQTAFALADNRSAELAAWDYDPLRALTAEVSEANRDLLVGWNDNELEALVRGWQPGVHDITQDDEYSPDNETYVVKIQRVKASDKDAVLSAVSAAIEGLGYTAEAF